MHNLFSYERVAQLSEQYSDFLNEVEYGIRLDEKTIEFLGEERAIKTYEEYETLYAESDFGVYIPESCWSKSHFDPEAHFQRCIASYGQEKD